MQFTLKEDRELLETAISLDVPFNVSMVNTENVVVTKYTFVNYNSKKELSFAAVTRNGQCNYDFDESLLYEVGNWMKSENVSSLFKEYIDYKEV